MMSNTVRRNILFAIPATIVAFPFRSRANERPPIHVFKGTGCECCDAWVEYLKQQGFQVTDEEMFGTLLIKKKMQLGIPAKIYSCHTGVVDGYALEGHVPALDILRLLEERPTAIGLAVPGMPYGSPGMGDEERRERFDVLLVRKGGEIEVFSRYPAA